MNEEKEVRHDEEKLTEFLECLSKAQIEMMPAKKDKTAKGGAYNFNYADYKAVVDATRKHLYNNNLVVTDRTDYFDDKIVLTTTLFHTNGEFLESSMPLYVNQNDMRAVGSAISYAKRYMYCALIGVLSANEDDDAQAAVNSMSTVGKIKPFLKG